MDYEMPGMNGMKTIRGRWRRPATPHRIVMLSIHDDIATRRAAAVAGVRAFVAKHEPSEKLLAAIRDAASPRKEAEYVKS